MGLTRTSEVAIDREVEGDLFLQDIGQGFGFRPGSFDGAIRYEIQFTVLPCYRTQNHSQHLRATMATQRRDITPDVLASAPAYTFLHDAPLCATQPLTRRTAVLPDFRRPGPTDHVHRAKSWLWWRDRRRLPQLQKGAQGVSLSLRRRRRCRCCAAAVAEGARGRER